MNIKGKHSSVFAKAEDRPYTYLSRKNDKSKNLKSNCRFKIYETGNKSLQKNYHSKITLYVSEKIQIYQRLLETVRLLLLTNLNRVTDKKLSKQQFFFKVRKYTHQIVRLKTVVSAQKGISVDRLSKGMKLAFGKPEGLAIKVNRNLPLPEPLFELYLSKKYHQKYLAGFKDAMRRISLKTPLRTKLIKVELNPLVVSESFSNDELTVLRSQGYFEPTGGFKSVLFGISTKKAADLWSRANFLRYLN